MVIVRLKLQPASTGNLNRVFRHLDSVLRVIPDQIVNVGLETWEEEITRIFDVEGEPKWEALRPLTRLHRIILGHKPGHPILQRQRFLFWGLSRVDFPARIRLVEDVDLSDPDDPIIHKPMMTGSMIDSKESAPGHIIFRLGTLDERFLALHAGTTSIPSRPMVPETPQQKRLLGLKIETKVLRLVNHMVVP